MATTKTIVAPRDLAEKLAHEADSMKGEDVAILEVADVLFITDYFVLITAQTNRQSRAIAAALQDMVKPLIGEKGRLEGEQNSDWILLDFDTVIVHIFTPDAREFYNLENLWAEEESAKSDVT
ncbi:MAG: ribosome silencing factor [Planctomycetota bacterium]|nr:ribosome silencing factor [Planctomycetota bacterium]